MGSGEPPKFKAFPADGPAGHLSEADARRQAARVEAIARAQHELAVSDADEQELTGRIAEMAQRLLAADGGAFQTLQGGALRVRSVYGIAWDQVGTIVPLEGSLSGLAACAQQILRCDDVDIDPRVHHAEPHPPWKSIMCAPLRQGQEQQTVGVISVMSLQRGYFTPADETALELLAESLGAVLQRRRHAEQLAASESQYRSLFIDNPQPMCVYEPSTLKFLAVNDACIAQYGYSEAEFLRMSIDEMRPPEDLEAWRRDVLSRPLVGRARRRSRHRRKDGSVIHVDTFSNDILFQGRPARLVVAIDVTEQLNASNDLHRSEARFRALTELSADWYWEQDEQFRFIAVDGGSTYPPALAPPGEMLGKRRWELEGTEAEKGDWEQHRAQLLRHEPFRDFLVRRRIADGSVRLLSLAGTPIFDDQGRFTGYRGVGRDITEQRRAQEEIARLNAELEERVRLRTAQLEAANAELEAFSYSIAHDLRSPLTSIDGFSHTLDELCSDALGEQGRHYVRRIRAGVRQMSELTDAMLSLAQLSRVRLKWEPVDLAEVARGVFAQLRESEPHREATLETPRRLEAHGDPRLLGQVVANLVGNAWKFSANKPVTSIRFGCTRQGDGESVFFVADQGAGFDMTHASRLFGAFQRLHSPSEFDGTGIGLALVQKIVMRHGGRIWAHAVPGEGATFYFTLADDPVT
jgi:PAS domain S-box-containing protein